MKGKFITTQIMIVCMGNKTNRSNETETVNNKTALPVVNIGKTALMTTNMPLSGSQNKAA